MYDHEDMSERNEFHLDMIGQIWGKIAGEIYDQYKKRGRGVVVMFMMDDIPEELQAILPRGAKPSGQGGVATYIPRDSLLPLEDFVGEQGLLRIDHKLGEYDPDTTIVFAFIEKIENDEGKKGIVSSGYEITPPLEHTPQEMYKNKDSFTRFSPINQGGKNNPLTNLN